MGLKNALTSALVAERVEVLENVLLHTDQLGREITLPHFPPRRIVSLVPSQTELLHALGLQNEVVGITKFCVHPNAWFRTKTRVGGTKAVHMDRVEALQPDLIIANKEENTQEQIEELSARYPVWISDVRSLDDAGAMIRQVGALTGKAEAAQQLADSIEQAFGAIEQPQTPKRAAYFIWRDPWMAAGGDTFINELMPHCGLHNVFAEADGRYPEVSAEALRAANPELILLSSEPFPFQRKHMWEAKEACPDAMVVLADGELFSWYGSRLLKVPDYFRAMMREWD